jgi:hypothetical protein
MVWGSETDEPSPFKPEALMTYTVIEVRFYPSCTVLVFDDDHTEVIEPFNQEREPEPGEMN